MTAFCGLNCSKCIGYIASKSGKKEELDKVAKIWSKQFDSDIKAEQVICEGCRSLGRKAFFCASLCKIRMCCNKKGIKTCAECDHYPCEDLKIIFKHDFNAKQNLEKLICKGK